MKLIFLVSLTHEKKKYTKFPMRDEKKTHGWKIGKGIKSTLTFTTLPIDCDVENFLQLAVSIARRLLMHIFFRRGIYTNVSLVRVTCANHGTLTSTTVAEHLLYFLLPHVSREKFPYCNFFIVLLFPLFF